MTFKVDHVTVAASTLDPLVSTFTAAGLAPDYGGPHSNGITHMSLVGFDDGSYMELISSLQPGQDCPWWHAHISGDGGPCAWCVAVDDVAAESARLLAAGVPVRGPTLHHRRRPDGALVEWDLSYVGDHEAGAFHPFIIRDRTPRELRVRASASVAGGPLRGVAVVLLGVSDAPAATAELRRVYGLAEPREAALPGLADTHVVVFPGEPVALCSPRDGDGWLAHRLARFGDSPCGYLLAAEDMAAVAAVHPLTPPQPWQGARVAWFCGEGIDALHIGAVG